MEPSSPVQSRGREIRTVCFPTILGFLHFYFLEIKYSFEGKCKVQIEIERHSHMNKHLFTPFPSMHSSLTSSTFLDDASTLVLLRLNYLILEP